MFLKQLQQQNKTKQKTFFLLGFWSSSKANFSKFETQKSQRIGGKLVGYLQSVEDMTQGSPKTNPESSRSEI